MIKILLADDSLLARAILKDIFLQAPDIAIIGEAVNGREAVDKTRLLKPDLVVMDILMPVMDGIAAIEEIMANCPVPILVLSATLEDRAVNSAFTAIRKGALDVMGKPGGVCFSNTADFNARLIDKVRLLSRIKVIHHPISRIPPAELVKKTLPRMATIPSILAIGASTGGPRAVVSIIKTFPASFPGTIFVVQHIAQGFAQGFARWLDTESRVNVRVAEEGDSATAAGTVFVAPNDYHMTVENGKIALIDTPPVNSCRPSIDVFFRSLATDMGAKTMGVLLTGMGKDGAEGLLEIRRQGGLTVAQDEQTSVVFGMPKAAIGLDAVNHILPLEEIPEFISRTFIPQNRRPTDRTE